MIGPGFVRICYLPHSYSYRLTCFKASSVEINFGFYLRKYQTSSQHLNVLYFDLTWSCDYCWVYYASLTHLVSHVFWEPFVSAYPSFVQFPLLHHPSFGFKQRLCLYPNGSFHAIHPQHFRAARYGQSWFYFGPLVRLQLFWAVSHPSQSWLQFTIDDAPQQLHLILLY